VLVWAGCDAFETLEQDPQNSLSGEQVLSNADGVRSVLFGAYNDMQGFMDDFTIFASLGSDLAAHTGSFPSWQDIDNHQMDASNPEAEGIWDGVYETINTANLLVARAQAADFDDLSEQEAANIRAQARVIRAFGYHGLVRWFGGHDGLSDLGVPIITEPTQTIDDVQFPARATVGEVYDQIIADLEQAEGAIQTTGAAGFADVDVARALLARAHLYRASIQRRAGNASAAQSDYAEAEANARAVLDRGRFALSTLGAVYDGLNSSESIWELQYNSQDANAMSFFGRPNGFGGRFEYGPDPNRFLPTIDSLDDRRDINLRTAGGTTFIGKYFRQDGSDHHFLVRLPEVKLTLAEALVQQDFEGNKAEAVAQINDIRERAYNEDIDGTQGNDFQEAGAEIDPAGVTSLDQMMDLITAERRIELAFEGHRWHDLNRLGITGEVETLPSPDARRFPIPQEAIDVNENLDQNPGF
jgi:hypothetical protein